MLGAGGCLVLVVVLVGLAGLLAALDGGDSGSSGGNVAERPEREHKAARQEQPQKKCRSPGMRIGHKGHNRSLKAVASRSQSHKSRCRECPNGKYPASATELIRWERT